MFYKDYSVLPISIVVDLISNINLSNLQILSKYIEIHDKLTLFTVFRFKEDFLNFIIVSINGNTIKFYGVNYQKDLLNCWELESAIQIQITTTRGIIKFSWRGCSHSISLHLPSKCSSFEDAKSSILCLFTLPSFTYILCNKIIIHFTRFQNKIFPSFIGHFKNGKIVLDTEWDISEKFIIGKIYKNIVYVLNDSFCIMTNQYPEIGNDSKENILIGNGYNYLITHNHKKVCAITYAYSNSFVVPELNGNCIHTVFFSDFIQIKRSTIFFLGIINPKINKNKSYAILGTSSFINTNKTNGNLSLPIEYVQEKDDTFQQQGTLYFKLMLEKLLILENGFSEFLNKNKSSQTLSNISLYDSSKYEYDPIQNKLSSKYIKPKNIRQSFFMNEKIKEYFNKLPHKNDKFLQKNNKQSPLLQYFGKAYSL